MKKTKIDFYSVSNKGNHLYEFSSNIELSTIKPLTKIIISESISIGVPVEYVKIHRRNSIVYEQPFNGKNKIGANIFKQNNVVKFYCNKSKS